MGRKPTTRSDRLAMENYLRDLLKKQQQRISELKEQLKNAIVPKFKIGQEVYYIRGSSNKRIDKGVIYGFVNNQCIRLKTSNNTHLTRDLIFIFNTKEEAKAKLKEFRGE